MTSLIFPIPPHWVILKPITQITEKRIHQGINFISHHIFHFLFFLNYIILIIVQLGTNLCEPMSSAKIKLTLKCSCTWIALLIQSRVGLSVIAALANLIFSIFPYLAVLSLSQMSLLGTVPDFIQHLIFLSHQASVLLSFLLFHCICWSLTSFQNWLTFPQMYFWQYSQKLLIKSSGIKMVHGQITLKTSG